ncbi:hydrogenase iron-sulfur subunit [Promethearchaeum syntrophicum]|uniref:Hydrogenase iron-sulfur subunit n=1 Tax=Promethearchaeum syntrophicum TaxID=2594042 RepID=A0A5B9DDY0_9ARCH|nr:hydrogenase iron-sulfur subunit [Candidatus Prometheoarchaeum syntrophicum]QEE16973.1 F420-non-reducing hydrogenase iron-sulfur subunit D [Candidatus Prometheoarchaeum syntrophicum]
MEKKSNDKVKEVDEFDPFILAIFCNWCTYTGADQAGTSRMQRPANLRIMRVMCSGRVEARFIIEALKRGADGVLIGACHIGDCHYVSGNHKTVRRMPIIREFVKQYGFNPKRVRLEHISASEGAELTEISKEFVKELKLLGKNPRNNK